MAETKKPTSKINLNHLPDNTIEIEVTIDQKKIKEEYDRVLADFQKNTEVKGFRKGKAPKEKVEKVIGQNEIYQQVINNILPRVYQRAVEEQQLKPIISPRAELISAKDDKDWQVKFTTCQLPEVDLNNYKEEVKKVIAKETIWTPEKGKPATKENKDLQKAKKFQTIIDTLAKTVKVTLPKVLIDNEVNQKLAALVEKTEKLGLSIDQYLATLGKTAEEIKNEYQQESEKNWKLELALNKISDEKKVVVSDQDIDEALNKISNPKEKEQLANQRYMLSSMIRRQKTLELLQNL
ncbi:MAG: trigger factor [Candidatus Shapirobacteria bacterium]|nr:trigger factor [Candidatus Shapirobacteria bacterium]MDD5073748.1 trigger factor [Candidatus Shapirobacteria bacterium]MDD5481651.1 trigger factor [Candidatus Shapirobacteria bacterium]